MREQSGGVMMASEPQAPIAERKLKGELLHT